MLKRTSWATWSKAATPSVQPAERAAPTFSNAFGIRSSLFKKQYSVELLSVSVVRNHTFELDVHMLISPVLYPRLIYTRNQLSPYKASLCNVGKHPIRYPLHVLCSMLTCREPLTLSWDMDASPFAFWIKSPVWYCLTINYVMHTEITIASAQHTEERDKG